MPSANPRAALSQIALITFLNYAARGFVLPFVNLYLKSTGFSATQIGLLTSVSASVVLVITPTLHTLADRTNQHRRLFYSLLLSNTLALLGLVANIAQLFTGGAIIIRDSSDTPSAALLSQLTITWLDENNRSLYGMLRAWGSLGWAMTTWISGRVFAIGGYPLLFIMAALLNLLLLPLVKVLPKQTTGHREYEGPPAPRSATFYIYMVSVFLFFMGNNAISVFGYIYFKENLGASNEYIGIISAVAALAEIPSMLFIDWLLRRMNIRMTLIIGTTGQALLWLGYSMLVGPSLLVPLMMLRGTFYTFFVISSTLLVARISHPANVATNQAIGQVTVPGLATLLTGSISGWLFDVAGPRFLFQLAALMGLLASGLLVVAWQRLGTEVQRMQSVQMHEAPAP